MSTRGYCSTVSPSQLVRGPSVRAHSTTVSHRPHGIARVGPSVTCVEGRGRTYRGCARARGLGRRAGSAVCFAGPRPGAPGRCKTPSRVAPLPFRRVTVVFAIPRISFRTERGARTVRRVSLSGTHTGLSNLAQFRRLSDSFICPICPHNTLQRHLHEHNVSSHNCLKAVNRGSDTQAWQHNRGVITRAGRRAPHATSSSASPCRIHGRRSYYWSVER
jgi:hypothetical protein